MTPKLIMLRPASVNLLEQMFEKRKKQIKKRYAAKIESDWYDFDDLQVHSKLCEVDKEYNEMDIILNQLF